MYLNTKTWNPAVGCNYDCIYCEPSFKRQLKRVAGNPLVAQGVLEYSENMYNSTRIKGGCTFCKLFTPHYHPERLKRTNALSKSQIFVFAHGDISFYNKKYVIEVLKIIKLFKNKIFFLQSKNPICFNNYLEYLDDNVLLLTTLETNRDINYEYISKAPLPSKRYNDFLNLQYKRKVVTIEPIMDFDSDIFLDWLLRLKKQDSLEYVWIGFNSKPNQVSLPEPNYDKVINFIIRLKENNIKIMGKDLRKIKLDL